MKKTTKSEQPIVTRAEKKDAVKQVLRELLASKEYKHNDLIEEASNVYAQRFSGDDTENKNDVRGRIGSVIDIMKKEEEVVFDGGRYALKEKTETEEKPVVGAVNTTEKPKTKRTTRGKKTEQTSKEAILETSESAPKNETAEQANVVSVNEPKKDVSQEKNAVKEEAEIAPAPKKRGRKPSVKTEATEEKKTKKRTATAEEKNTKTEITALQQEEALPIPAPIVTLSETTSNASMTENEPVIKEEKKATDEKTDVVQKTTEQAVTAEERTERKAENVALVPRAEKQVPSNVVMDMSFLLGSGKGAEKRATKTERTEKNSERKAEALHVNEPVVSSQSVRASTESNTETPKIENKKADENKKDSLAEKTISSSKTYEKATEKSATKTEKGTKPVALTNEKRRVRVEKAPTKALTADEKLRDAFLKKIRSLGGDYFEYYSVYLLEKYSRKNGRRLEGLKITGGGNDGGIDGEIELTDRLGFKETIYIQSKNWNPEKGDERLWVVGETLLQQFIGACVCRQAKEGKQHCRGIFITTSRFTPDAKRILETMSEKIVGYDGDDLYETAKECEFGIVNKNGVWTLDEQLLSGERAFFRMF